MATVENSQISADHETPTTTLLRLLPEFTALSKQIVMEADMLRTRREIYRMLSGLAISLSAIALVFIAVSVPVFDGPLFRSPGAYTSHVHYDSTKWISALVGLFLLLFLSVSGVASLSLQQASSRMSRFAVSNSATQLKGLVRTASQILEYGEADFSQRLELNLRIAEAENVLSYASYYLRPNMSSSKTGMSKTDLELDLSTPHIKNYKDN